MPHVSHPDTDRFLSLLDKIDFPGRYYALSDRKPAPGPRAEGDESQPVLAQLAALEKLGVHARMLAPEKLFEISKGKPPVVGRMQVGFRAGELELAVFLDTPQGQLGGTAQTLAMQVGLRRNPSFKQPAHARPRYSTPDDQSLALREALKLFDEIHGAAAAVSWK